MKTIIAFLSLIIPFYSFATELKIPHGEISCLGKNDKGLFEYRVGLVLQNTGEISVTLVTESNSVSMRENEDNIPVVLIGNNSEFGIAGVMIIPRDEELGLVVVRPSEGAQVYDIYKSRYSLGNRAIIGYHASSIYGGRYNNWNGIVTTKALDIRASDSCQP